MNRPKGGRHTHVRAFTIIEVIVIVVILGVLAAVIAPRFLNRIGSSKTAVANSNAASLQTALKLFIADCGMPESGSDLGILWQRPSDVEEADWAGPYIDSADHLLDPWGNPFELLIPSEHGNADFDIVSYGADGQAGGEGENADIVKP